MVSRPTCHSPPGAPAVVCPKGAKVEVPETPRTWRKCGLTSHQYSHTACNLLQPLSNKLACTCHRGHSGYQHASRPAVGLVGTYYAGLRVLTQLCPIRMLAAEAEHASSLVCAAGTTTMLQHHDTSTEPLLGCSPRTVTRRRLKWLLQTAHWRDNRNQTYSCIRLFFVNHRSLHRHPTLDSGSFPGEAAAPYPKARTAQGCGHYSHNMMSRTKNPSSLHET